MLKHCRLLKQEPQNLDEKYFHTVRPKRYELHSGHAQYGQSCKRRSPKLSLTSAMMWRRNSLAT